MTAEQLIKALNKYPHHLPVCDGRGDELSVVCYNDDPQYGIDDDTYDDEPYLLIV